MQYNAHQYTAAGSSQVLPLTKKPLCLHGACCSCIYSYCYQLFVRVQTDGELHQLLLTGARGTSV
jgi:hypothetical protein